MTKGKAIALGIASIWPGLYMVLFMGFKLLVIAATVSERDDIDLSPAFTPWHSACTSCPPSIPSL